MNARRAGDLVIVADPAALAREVAERFVAHARTATRARGGFDVALAGGTTPKAAYALLASPAYRSAVAWEVVRFFFSDERCVPPDHPDSNYGMAHDALLAPLRIDPGHVYRMHGEDAPGDAATAYAKSLREALGDAVTLDLVMLGMGTDGHTASLFPGSDPFEATGQLVRAPFVATVGAHRLTFTPQTINAARDVAIATAGSAKAPALHIARQGTYDPVRTPIQSVAPTDGRLTWLVDRAAAADIR